MGRLQQTKSGKRPKLRPLHQEDLRAALNQALDARGMPRPRKSKTTPPPA